MLVSRKAVFTMGDDDDANRLFLLESFEAVTVTMAKVFSLVDSELAKLNKNDSRQTLAFRIRFMWVESDLNEMMSQIRDQRDSLLFLIQFVQM